MNPTKYYEISKAINEFWIDNDIYVIALLLFLFAVLGIAHLIIHYYEWLFNLIEDDNARTYYTNPKRRYES